MSYSSDAYEDGIKEGKKRAYVRHRGQHGHTQEVHMFDPKPMPDPNIK